VSLVLQLCRMLDLGGWLGFRDGKMICLGVGDGVDGYVSYVFSGLYRLRPRFAALRNPQVRNIDL
jgi:hypothetical protein